MWTNGVLWVKIVDPMANDFSILMLVYPVSWFITGSMVLTAYFIIRRRVEREFAEWDTGGPAAV